MKMPDKVEKVNFGQIGPPPKLYKNHWVKPFFVIFRFVRDILLVTVAFDHPVARKDMPVL